MSIAHQTLQKREWILDTQIMRLQDPETHQQTQKEGLRPAAGYDVWQIQSLKNYEELRVKRVPSSSNNDTKCVALETQNVKTR